MRSGIVAGQGDAMFIRTIAVALGLLGAVMACGSAAEGDLVGGGEAPGAT
ncbi:MAG: hypothetical protein FJ104_00720, partial [Deltaproteobacteria bacterium]|nr:hypothetical protein [Deltaproteobacteria bacterium]